MAKINQNFVPTVTLAGVTILQDKATSLTASVGTANYYDTFRKNNAPYQVPVGKILRVRAIFFTINSATGSLGPIFGYGDSAVSNSAAGPTNGIYFSMGGYNVLSANPGTAQGQAIAISFDIPAGKYPVMQGLVATTFIQMLCEEI